MPAACPFSDLSAGASSCNGIDAPLEEDQYGQVAYKLSLLSAAGSNPDENNGAFFNAVQMQQPYANGASGVTSPSGSDERSGKPRSSNTTECVNVPSSEHVAEIVGRQGCKIKALRAKTNTYIKTPVRGEEPVFVVTGRREDVLAAKKEIQSAAEHFTAIRARRGSTANGSLSCLGNGSNGPPSPQSNHVTIHVPVTYQYVGLVVGLKGATIKRIQQQTHTYIVTPSRDKEPVFEVTGTPENVESARRQIQAHIQSRTGSAGLSDVSNLFINNAAVRRPASNAHQNGQQNGIGPSNQQPLGSLPGEQNNQEDPPWGVDVFDDMSASLTGIVAPRSDPGYRFPRQDNNNLGVAYHLLRNQSLFNGVTNGTIQQNTTNERNSNGHRTSTVNVVNSVNHDNGTAFNFPPVDNYGHTNGLILPFANSPMDSNNRLMEDENGLSDLSLSTLMSLDQDFSRSCSVSLSSRSTALHSSTYSLFSSSNGPSGSSGDNSPTSGPLQRRSSSFASGMCGSFGLDGRVGANGETSSAVPSTTARFSPPTYYGAGTPSTNGTSSPVFGINGFSTDNEEDHQHHSVRRLRSDPLSSNNMPVSVVMGNMNSSSMFGPFTTNSASTSTSSMTMVSSSAQLDHCPGLTSVDLVGLSLSRSLNFAENRCAICQENPRQTLFFPCGDTVTCLPCANHLLEQAEEKRQCPTCGKAVTQAVPRMGQ